MSLNGLDSADVADAYNVALAEAGGWFLLSYVSRDEVKLLGRGTGGASDVRSALAQYPDKSPLYGFLLYRRRKVLIKYLPDGTSRLQQARVAVQFLAVTEKFSPHDTVLSIATADELSDSALASACSLHTAATASSSSSASPRLRKLDEITEDAEEAQGSSNRTSKTATPIVSSAEAGDDAPTAPSDLDEKPPAAARTHVAETDDAETSNESRRAPEETAAQKEDDSAPTTGGSAANFSHYDDLFENGPDPRSSSQTARPAISDIYAEIYAQYNKPKVRLGPRPKQSLDAKRPRTSGEGSSEHARPVSSLPAGLRVMNRKPAETRRPKSRDSSQVPSIGVPPPPPVPIVPEITSPAFQSRGGPGSIRSLPVNTYGAPSQRGSGVSQEKQRLLKAMELRKKQMIAKTARKEQQERRAREEAEAEARERETSADVTPVPEAESMKSPATEPSADFTSVPEAEGAGSPATEPSIMDDGNGNLAHGNDTADASAERPEPEQTPPSPMADIPKSLDLASPSESSHNHLESVDILSAASASSPTSAQTLGSSCAPSTRPSSLSDDGRPLAEEQIDSKPLDVALTPMAVAADGHDSIDSTPTIMQESATPTPQDVPQLDTNASTLAVQPVSSTDSAERASERESVATVLANDADEMTAQRKSKRQSLHFLSTTQPIDAAQMKKKKRESVIMGYPGAREGDRNSRHMSTDNSEAEYLSDDSFLEELRGAKFEDAKPISVVSPVASSFSKKAAASDTFLPWGSASASPSETNSPKQISMRKASGPWIQHANTDTVVVAKKINVSSGISQRIKALAEKSSRDSPSQVSPSSSPDGGPSLVAQRKTSFFSPAPSGSPPLAKPVQRPSRTSFITVPFAPAPDKKPKLQVSPGRIEEHQAATYNVRPSMHPADTVQVTARIVRDPHAQRQPTLTMPTETTPLDLQQSQIIIDHQKPMLPPKSPARTEPTSPRLSIASASKDPSPGAPRSSSETSWRSFGLGRRTSESKQASASASDARSPSAHSGESSEDKADKERKRESRTSKMFKRMSSSMSRKNSAASPTLEEQMLASSLPSVREPPPPVQVGDLNIQFPDTLLWKRRWVEIDASGNLVLSLSKSNESKGITKRFHLSEFRTPYAPDQDRQELPNSVILDFIDGRTLQCACETYATQVQVLQVLREAHDAWLAYGQGQ